MKLKTKIFGSCDDWKIREIKDDIDWGRVSKERYQQNTEAYNLINIDPKGLDIGRNLFNISIDEGSFFMITNMPTYILNNSGKTIEKIV